MALCDMVPAICHAAEAGRPDLDRGASSTTPESGSDGAPRVYARDADIERTP